MAARTMVAGASLGLLQALFQSAEGLERAMPTQTVFADDHADILGWTPKPTNLPVMGRMRRRDEPIPSGTCGYVSESEFNSITCPNGEYCGVRTDWNVMGCCTGYYKTGGIYSMTGCQFVTACIESAGLDSCDEDCLANYHNTICSDPAYPYCMSYSYTDVGFSILYCDKYADVVTYCGETYAGEFTSTVTTLPPSIPASTSASITSAITESTISPSSQLTDGLTSASLIITVPSLSQPQNPTQSSKASSSINAAGPAPASQSQKPGSSNSNIQSSNSTDQSTTSGSSTASSKGTNIGAIVGGIVGGLALIAVAAGIAIWFGFRRLKRRRESPSSASTGPMSQAPHGPTNVYTQQSPISPYVHSAAPPSTQATSPSFTSPSASNSGVGHQQWQPYDNVTNGLHPVGPDQQIAHNIPNQMSNRYSASPNLSQYAQHSMPSEMYGTAPAGPPPPNVHEVHGYGAGKYGVTELPG